MLFLLAVLSSRERILLTCLVQYIIFVTFGVSCSRHVTTAIIILQLSVLQLKGFQLLVVTLING